MNVIDLLKKDHDTVEELFKSFEKAKENDDESRLQIAQQICQELTAHATVEEELFYPAVDQKAEEDEDAQEKVKEADEEHRLAKALIAEIEGMDTSDDHFDAKVKVLKDVIEHHVEEEEGELMPKARKLLSSEELDEIGSQVEARKEELKMEPVGAGSGLRPRGGNRSRRAPATRRRSSAGSRSRGSSSRRTSSGSSRARSSASSRGRSSRSRGRKY
jgi:hemerythrin superfamily protein